MRIIIDATTTQNEWKSNGIGFYTRNIIINLIKEFPSMKFILLMYDSPSEIDSLISANHSNLEIVRMGTFQGKNLLNPMWYVRQLFPGVDMLSALRKVYQKGDIFFSPFFWGGLPLSIPFVVTIHDFAFPRFNIYSQISFLHNLARATTFWIEMYKTLRAKYIITDAQFTVSDYLSYLPKYPKDRIVAIHLGLDIELKETDVSHLLPADWQQMGYLINLGGGYTKNKNMVGVIEGFARYVQKAKERKLTPAYLVIAGKNFQDTNIADIKALHQLIADRGVKDLVYFSGRYDDGSRYSLFKNCSISINLSLYEGFGFALLEGMKAGAPTIAHNGSCYPEVVKDGAILVNGKDIEEVSDAILNLMVDTDVAQKLSMRGKEVVEVYDWKVSAQKTYNVLVKSLENK